VDLILEDIVPCEEIEDFRIVVSISCVIMCMGEGHTYWSTHFQLANNMAAIGRG
jgi:hypothetical protein